MTGKIFRIFFTALALLQVSFSYSQQSKNGVAKKTSSTLLFFAGTTDLNFCNKDSVIEGDCINGHLYLTDKGNAIYIYYCCCDNPTIYKLGKFKVEGDSIVCQFNKEYTVGKGMKNDRWNLSLKKLVCPNYTYFFTETTEDEVDKNKVVTQNYVLGKAKKQETTEFLKAISKFKQLKSL